MRLNQALFAAIASVALMGGALAQSFPDKPIKVIIPFPPGGGTDIFGRIIADGLSRELGQPVVVDNRAGASGIIGTLAVAKSAPDGYTLGIATVGTHATNGACNSKVGYDPVTDFAPITNVARTPNVVAVYADFPAKDFKEFMAYTKKHPNTVAFATSGTCGLHHLTAEHFKALTGADITHIPYRGTGPALIDVVGGRVAMIFDSLPAPFPHIQAGKLRALAVASARRLDALPAVPTYAELGLKDLNDPVWYGLVAPAGTPADIINKINAAAGKVLSRADVQQRIKTAGGEAAYNSPAEYAAEIKTASDKMKSIVKTRGITPD